jgi:hypothetical protein
VDGYELRPLGALEVTRDGGATWEPYFTIRTEYEAARCWYEARKAPDRFRVVLS